MVCVCSGAQAASTCRVNGFRSKVLADREVGAAVHGVMGIRISLAIQWASGGRVRFLWRAVRLSEG